MGNAVASSSGSGRVRIMKHDGEVMKFKAPLTVNHVLRNYRNHVIVPAEAVSHLGTRTKPLDESTHLSPKILYLLIEMPKPEDLRVPNRVRPTHTSAKSRLQAMLVAHRSISDISAVTCVSPSSVGGEESIRVKVRMSKAQLTQLAAESHNSSETAEKILDFFLDGAPPKKIVRSTQTLTEKSGLETSAEKSNKVPKNRVRFSPHVQCSEVF